MEQKAAAERVNRITLARFERWILPRLAIRLPRWVTPDKLTILGIVASLGIGGAYALTFYSLHWLWVASALLVVHWYADSLDGTLARVRDIRRERYGFYVDHQSDAISTAVIFVGLGVSPLMLIPVALGIIIAYFLMMILVNLVTIARDVFKISFAGVGPTEVRLIIIASNTLVWWLGNPRIGIWIWTPTLFDIIGVIAIAALLVTYVVTSLMERSELARLDPTPVRNMRTEIDQAAERGDVASSATESPTTISPGTTTLA
ncbi:hypothetical protein BH23BAC4_BH23BAC4_05040 [soil metagenome]